SCEEGRVTAHGDDAGRGGQSTRWSATSRARRFMLAAVYHANAASAPATAASPAVVNSSEENPRSRSIASSAVAAPAPGVSRKVAIATTPITEPSTMPATTERNHHRACVLNDS